MYSVSAETLKQNLFMEGLEAIQDFLGYEIDPEEDKDVTDLRMDEVLEQMPDEEFDKFWRKYCAPEEEEDWREVWMT